MLELKEEAEHLVSTGMECGPSLGFLPCSYQVMLFESKMFDLEPILVHHSSNCILTADMNLQVLLADG